MMNGYSCGKANYSFVHRQSLLLSAFIRNPRSESLKTPIPAVDNLISPWIRSRGYWCIEPFLNFDILQKSSLKTYNFVCKTHYTTGWLAWGLSSSFIKYSASYHLAEFRV